ncbi:hypothetical protein ABBQ38_014179 [Trebouxia sp. C0009 RCD-2024]
MKLCAKKVTDTLQSSALHVVRPSMMVPWMSHLSTGLAPQDKAGPGKDPHLAGPPTQTAPWTPTGGIAFVLKTGQQQWLASRAEGVLRSDFFVSTQQVI